MEIIQIETNIKMDQKACFILFCRKTFGGNDKNAPMSLFQSVANSEKLSAYFGSTGKQQMEVTLLNKKNVELSFSVHIISLFIQPRPS